MLRRTLDILCPLFGAVAAGMLALMALAIIIQIGARAVGIPFPDAGELSGFVLAAMSFLALPYVFREGAHIRVNLLLSNLSGKPRRVAEVWCLLVSLGLIGYLAWSSIVMTVESYDLNSVSTGLLSLPLWIPQMGLSAGASLLVLVLIEGLVDVYRDVRPRYERAEQQGSGTE